MRIAIFLPMLAPGGAEHVMLTLARGFVLRGQVVDLVLVKAAGPLLPLIPEGLRVVELGTRRVSHSVPALAKYLRRERPAALLSTLKTANAVAILAARLAGHPTRVVIRQAEQLSRSLHGWSGPSTALVRLLVRYSYPRADAIVAVSNGVADDLAKSVGVPRAGIHVLPNPILTPELSELAARPLDHAWFAAGTAPVILGVGRLSREKQFDVLIRAFARVRQRRDVRLMILGEGEERPRLTALIGELGLESGVSLPGYVANPFCYMARASVFVLSSAWEGLPGVLIQALGCGTPVVATDCDSGPREILQGGELGRLVPVGDTAALAEAICATLSEPHVLRSRPFQLPYTESAGVEAYLRVLDTAPR